MREVAVATLKAQLSDYLQYARQGEQVLITENGRKVALLAPMEPSAPERRAWDLVQAGAASWSGGKPLGSRRRPKLSGKSASDIVLEDRR
ncbi:MAG TPA: type II toxin-antitoxin system prevent-host-death family antitoxin [Thermoanaerobaculia bacterium]|nr:type II toxin-antitoxin system prevent-host-death family antitoxin [Thermoanaerobaculia bacterium]